MENLAEEQILTDFTWIAGESRTNLAVVDPTTGEQTEINERGPDVSSEELDRFLEKLLYLARGARICVIAGSLPPSVPASFAARMISELKELGTETLLDTEGEPLVARLRAGVGVVTPNASEAEGAVDHEFNDRDDLLAGPPQPDRAGGGGGRDHERARLRRVADRARGPGELRGHGPRARAGRHGRVGRRLPGRLRRGALRRPAGPGVPALRRRLRGRVDPALRRRARSTRPRSSGRLAGRGRGARHARRRPLSRPADPGAGLTAVIVDGALAQLERQRRKERFSSLDAPACRGFFVRERT